MNHKYTAAGVLLALFMWGSLGATVDTSDGTLLSRVIEKKSQQTVGWRIISAAEVSDGTTIPVNTNVVFTLPMGLSPSGTITREALLGGFGETVRYWGYCLPQDKAAHTVKKQTLPGQVFISEAERRVRLKEWEAKLPKFSIYNLPTTDRELAKQNMAPPKGLIRHEKELFSFGEVCYIMVGGKMPLPFGADNDGDGLNNSLEKAKRTDKENADSDADGISDGVEVLRGKTNPLAWDTDGDGLSDGIEDANRNGRRDQGETDPLRRDSDNDGLCDGRCPFGIIQSICGTGSGQGCIDSSRTWIAGEDRNLNGKRDDGETDPLKAYSDGIHHDYELYLNCRFQGGTEC